MALPGSSANPQKKWLGSRPISPRAATSFVLDPELFARQCDMVVVLRCLLCDALQGDGTVMLARAHFWTRVPELLVVINVSGLVSFKAGAHIRSHQVD